MPNHVANRLTIQCDEQRGREVMRDYCFAEEDKALGLDFAKLIPPPPGCMMGDLGAVHEEIWPLNWLSWSRENWGTKWNSYSGASAWSDGTLTITFHTAWNPPHRVVLALVQATALGVLHEWSCEGACTWGAIEYSGTGGPILIDYKGGVHRSIAIAKQQPPLPHPLTHEDIDRKLRPHRYEEEG